MSLANLVPAMRSRITSSLAMALSSTIIAAMLNESGGNGREGREAGGNEGLAPSKKKRNEQSLSMVKNFGMR